MTAQSLPMESNSTELKAPTKVSDLQNLSTRVDDLRLKLQEIRTQFIGFHKDFFKDEWKQDSDAIEERNIPQNKVLVINDMVNDCFGVSEDINRCLNDFQSTLK